MLPEGKTLGMEEGKELVEGSTDGSFVNVLGGDNGIMLGK